MSKYKQSIVAPKKWVKRALDRAMSITPRQTPEIVRDNPDWWGGFAYDNYHNHTIQMLQGLQSKPTWTRKDEIQVIIISVRLEGTCKELEVSQIIKGVSQ